MVNFFLFFFLSDFSAFFPSHLSIFLSFCPPSFLLSFGWFSSHFLFFFLLLCHYPDILLPAKSWLSNWNCGFSEQLHARAALWQPGWRWRSVVMYIMICYCLSYSIAMTLPFIVCATLGPVYRSYIVKVGKQSYSFLSYMYVTISLLHLDVYGYDDSVDLFTQDTKIARDCVFTTLRISVSTMLVYLLLGKQSLHSWLSRQNKNHGWLSVIAPKNATR